VHVHVDRVADATGRWARLRVRDDGAGMDAHTRARIFDPYFSTKAPGKGTGLGLPIVRSLVDALGGQIHIESAPGAGTTFTLLLPESDPTSDAAGPTPVHTVSARTEPASSPTSHAEASAAAHGATSPARRILLVDDEESVRRATARLLESLGHSVTAVASADAALDALHAAPGTFGLLLTDFRMPGASGAELARTVRARDVALPIVLMSGHIDDAERDGAPPAGIGRLQKPFTRAELAAAITAMPDAVHDGAAAA
jgi:CheY-like chemotaxis protein